MERAHSSSISNRGIGPWPNLAQVLRPGSCSLADSSATITMGRTSVEADGEDKHEAFIFQAPNLLVADLLDGELEISESKLKLIMKIADDMEIFVEVYRFNEMQPGENLKDHVLRHLDAGTCKGPFDDGSLVFLTRIFMKLSQIPNLDAGRDIIAQWWRGGGNCLSNFWRAMDESQTPIHQVNSYN